MDASHLSPVMIPIGGHSYTVPAGTQQTVTVPATLIGGLNAIDIQWTITSTVPGGGIVGGPESTISSDCAILDASCYQAAINPVGMSFSLAPLAILYEPPGNCSYAQFTANSIQGTTIAIDQVNATNDGTLSTIPNSLTQTTTVSNATTSHSDDNSKSNQMQVTLGVTMGTVEAPPTPLANCQTRTGNGPGHGDVFMIVDNAPLVYWNTGDLSSSRFAITTSDATTTEQIPSNILVETLIFTADDLANNQVGVGGTLSMASPAEVQAVLGLDVAVALAGASSSSAATTAPLVSLPLPRYVPIPSLVFDVAQNPGGLPLGISNAVTDTQATATIIKQAIDQVNSTMTLNGGVLAKIEQDILSSNGGLSKLLGAAGTAIPPALAQAGDTGTGGASVALGWVGTEVASWLGSLIDPNAGATTKTTIETTLTNSNTINTFVGGGTIQVAQFRDSNRNLNFRTYYDQLFGTLAFEEIPGAMGTMALSVEAAAAEATKPLASVAWVKTVVSGQDSTTAFPQSIAEQLSAVAGGGSFTLVPVPGASFQVHSGFAAGVPTGVTVGTAGLTGTTSATPGVYQQAFFIVDSAGNQDGVFWQAIAVAAPGASGNAICSTEPNSTDPGTEIVTCCSLAGICDSFVAPSTGLDIKLQAVNNNGQSGTTASSTALTSTTTGAFIKFSGVNLGPFDGLITNFAANLLPSAAGQSLQLWVDSPTTAGGGTLLATLAFDGPSVQNCAGSWADQHQTRSTLVDGAPSGSHDIYVVFVGPPGDSLVSVELSFEATPPAGPRVQYRPGDVGQPLDNQIQPWLEVANDGGTDLKLDKNLLIRYWYTIDTGAPEALNVDYAPFGAQNIAGTFTGLTVPMQEADHSLDISFPNGTCFVPPAGTSGEIHLRVNKTDWSNFNENNDYSYVAGRTSYANNMQITAYLGGKLVWGMEPAAVPGAESASSGLNFHVQYRVGDPGQPLDNAIKPQFIVFNDNTVSVPLSQLTLRYWFAPQSAVASQFWCDYAMIGNSNVLGTFVNVPTPLTGASRYLQVSFMAAAGFLYPLGSTGQIQTRVSQLDWSNFNELGDYSYNASDTSFANWLRVTMYRNGTLVWGTEP